MVAEFVRNAAEVSKLTDMDVLKAVIVLDATIKLKNATADGMATKFQDLIMRQ